MKQSLFQALVISGILLSGTTQSEAKDIHVKADNPNIAYTGRICQDNPLSPSFSYPGVSAAIDFYGSSIRMGAKPGSGYFMVELDDYRPFKINFTEQDSIVTIAEGLSEGKHSLRVYYAIEGYEKKPEFRGFYLSESGGTAAAPALPERRIEFIGNSITCGYGIEAESEKDDFSYSTENHYYSFASQAARVLGAQAVTVARSGYGIYRNYGGPIEGNDNCLPALYDRTLFYDADKKWDFSQWQPDVVCLNLGTNDTSLNKYDPEKLEQATRKFLKRLRKYYPNAKIVVTTGCLLTGERLKTVKGILDKVTDEARRKGDKAVYRFDMSPHTGSLGYGADWHPSLRQANKMAAELVPFLREITGWK